MLGGLGPRWARAAALLLVVASTTAGLGVGSINAGATPSSYVALGDSYTAGPLVPNQLADPAGCLRSDHDYPHLVAAALAVSTFQDASCSGAATVDMASPQNVTPGPNPPQLDRLTPTTQLVTLQIGGNDVGFESILVACASGSPNGTPCQDHFVQGGTDQISQAIAATAPKVAAVLQAIHTRAPLAQVLVVGYLDVFPEATSGCYPQLPFTAGDVPYLRAKEHELNAMLAQEAAANGAGYVDTYTPSIGHDACQPPCLRWVEPLVPASPAAPVHPNALGMQGAAAAVLHEPPPVGPPCVVAAAPRFTG